MRNKIASDITTYAIIANVISLNNGKVLDIIEKFDTLKPPRENINVNICEKLTLELTEAIDCVRQKYEIR